MTARKEPPTPADTAAPEIARISAACQRFGYSRSAIYRDAAAGKIRLVKRGRATLVDIASIRAFMASLPEAEIH